MLRRPSPPSPPQPDATRDPEGDEPGDHLPLEEPEPATLTLEDLDPQRRQDFEEQGMDALGEVIDRCEPLLDEPLQVAARSVLDDRGLVEIELSTYELDEERSLQPSDALIPVAFSDCMRDALWEQPWYELEPHERLPFMLTFDLAPADEHQ